MRDFPSWRTPAPENAEFPILAHTSTGKCGISHPGASQPGKMRDFSPWRTPASENGEFYTLAHPSLGNRAISPFQTPRWSEFLQMPALTSRRIGNSTKNLAKPLDFRSICTVI